MIEVPDAFCPFCALSSIITRDSFISVEGYAMAMMDELEQENHHRERFTIGY